MPKQFEVLGKRYNELRAQGITCKEAVKIINRESDTNMAEVTIRSYGAQYKKKFGEAESHSEQEEHNSHELEGDPEPILSEQKEGYDRGERKEDNEGNVQSPSLGQDELDNHIREIVKEVLQEMRHNVHAEGNIIDKLDDAPPEPRTLTGAGKGRRENRDYKKVSLTMDTVLWKLFVEECARRKISTGRLLDVVLWRHFGRPKLSYHQELESLDEGQKN